MARAPSTRAQWRAWIRTANPGEVRRRAGVRQDALAAALGVHPATLGGWERGSGLPGGDGGEWYRAVTRLSSARGRPR